MVYFSVYTAVSGPLVVRGRGQFGSPFKDLRKAVKKKIKAVVTSVCAPKQRVTSNLKKCAYLFRSFFSSK